MSVVFLNYDFIEIRVAQKYKQIIYSAVGNERWPLYVGSDALGSTVYYELTRGDFCDIY